jgi:hypothetical protein
MKFQSGTKTITRIQLPLIPAFALTVHKSQGLNKAYVLFVASSRLFARALSLSVDVPHWKGCISRQKDQHRTL